MTLDDVLAVLERGADQDVHAALVGLTDSERKALGTKARGWVTRGNPTRVSSDNASLAVLATAGGQRQAMVAVEWWSFGLEPSFKARAVEILRARAPAWLPQFVEAMLDGEAPNWALVRAIVRAGLVTAPTHPEYFRGTVHGAHSHPARHQGTLLEGLERDSEIIGDHLLGMLATERAGRALADHDRYEETAHDYAPGHVPSADRTWRVALCTLAEQDRVDRGALLDVVLAAPLRDWAPVDLGWYVGMHDALEPTEEEVLARQSTYARLLTVEHGPSVKAAQREIRRVLGAPGFDARRVLDASAATLGRTDKTSVMAQLRLLDELASSHPGLDVAGVVRTAVDHPRADVRERSLALLGRLGAAEPEATERAAFIAPAPVTWTPPAAVAPIASANELADVLLALLEEVDAIELERAVDGLLRFAGQRPATAELLWQRATTSELYSDDPRDAPMTLAHAWLAPRSNRSDQWWPVSLGSTVFPAESALPYTFVGALERRLTGITHAVSHRPGPSVALPNAADGSLEADELNARLRATGWRDRPTVLELGTALLRVPRDHRTGVEIPRRLRGDRGLDQVLAAVESRWDRRVVTSQENHWSPERRTVVFADLGAGPAGELTGILSRNRPQETVAHESQYGEYEARFEQTLAFGALLLPHDPDILAAHAHPYLCRDLRKDRAVSVPILDAVARSRTKPGAPACSALSLGLSAKDARGRIAAQDALIDLARRGVLDGTELGRQAALSLDDDIVTGQRLSTGLREVAAASEHAVLPLLDALQALLPVMPGRRDAGPFLELAADLVERTGRRVELPSALVELAARPIYVDDGEGCSSSPRLSAGPAGVEGVEGIAADSFRNPSCGCPRHASRR